MSLALSFPNFDLLITTEDDTACSWDCTVGFYILCGYYNMYMYDSCALPQMNTVRICLGYIFEYAGVKSLSTALLKVLFRLALWVCTGLLTLASLPGFRLFSTAFHTASDKSMGERPVYEAMLTLQ